MRARGTIHLLLGPVGAGKTTYAERRVAATSAVFFDLDAWMVRLYGPDPRPTEGVMAWYLERRERCRSLIWSLALATVNCGTDVILELGLLAAAERDVFYRQVQAEELGLRVVLLDAPRDVRRDRVLARNQSGRPFTQIVPPLSFERASDAWEPPTELERRTWAITDA